MEVHFDGGEPHARSIAIQGGVDVLGTASTEALDGAEGNVGLHGETWRNMEKYGKKSEKQMENVEKLKDLQRPSRTPHKFSMM
jgi:hypothetical protein